jgi:polysaccharide biosynthesis protein PelE
LEPPPISESKFQAINISSTEDISLWDVTLVISLTLLVFLIELQIIRDWLNEDMSISVFLGFHGGVVALLGFWTLMLHRFGLSLHLPPFLTIFTAVLGPVGIVGTLVAMSLYYLLKRSSTPFSDWYQALFPDFENEKIRTILEKATSTKDLHMEKQPVIPFIDVLHYGTTQQKQAMIVLLIAHHHGKFAGVLRKALEDKDGSVRVLAAKGMTKIEQYYMKRNMELENQFREKKISSDTLLKSQIMNDDEYIYSGILDSIRETDIRIRTIKSCKIYLKNTPEDLHIRFILGRMLLRSGKEVQAAEWYEESLRQGYKSPQIFAWYFECLYRLGQLTKLREQSAIYFDEVEQYKHVFQPDVFQVMKIWAESVNDSQPEPISNRNAEPEEPRVFKSILKTETA